MVAEESYDIKRKFDLIVIRFNRGYNFLFCFEALLEIWFWLVEVSCVKGAIIKI